VYVFNPFKPCSYEFVFTYRVNCRSTTVAERRARVLERCLNTNSIDRYLVRLSKIKECLVSCEDAKLPF
jgi:hypothetical protein